MITFQLKPLSCLMYLFWISHVVLGDAKLTYTQEAAARKTVINYCNKLSNYAVKHDSRLYDEIIGLFSHRDTQVYNDLRNGSESVTIYNYLTQIDQQRPTGQSLSVTYSTSPSKVKIIGVNKGTGMDAQVILKKTIRGGSKRHNKTVQNIIYVSLTDYRISGVFEQEPLVNNKTSKDIYFTNSCNYTVELVLRYMDNEGVWQTKGRWEIDQKKSYYLSLEGTGRIKTKNPTIYYYAKIVDDTYYWGGDFDYDFKGKNTPMRKSQMKLESFGAYSFYITCGNL